MALSIPLGKNQKLVITITKLKVSVQCIPSGVRGVRIERDTRLIVRVSHQTMVLRDIQRDISATYSVWVATCIAIYRVITRGYVSAVSGLGLAPCHTRWYHETKNVGCGFGSQHSLECAPYLDPYGSLRVPVTGP